MCARWFRVALFSRAFQRLSQVPDEIFGVLEANRKTYERACQRGAACCTPELRIAVYRQALEAAIGKAQPENPQAIKEAMNPRWWA
jgi:hypothetical protein